MAENYSINEIVRFAIEIEKEGEYFYDSMYGKTDNQKLQKLFISLRDDETEHKKIFMKILDSIEKDPNEYQYVLNTEYAGYFNNIIKNTVFNTQNIDNLTKNLNTEIKVLDYAIQKENNSIEYYNKLKNISGKNNNKIIDKIIKEEKKHADKLLKLKKIFK
jgi:rubrerythrin